MWYIWRYYVTHPHKLIEELFLKVKWAFQRMFRGWDDTYTWSLDYHLAKIIIPAIEKLRENAQGYPISFAELKVKGIYDPSDEEETERLEEWKDVLDKISRGFKAYIRIEEWDWLDEAELEALEETFKCGMELFVKHYSDLWN